MIFNLYDSGGSRGLQRGYLPPPGLGTEIKNTGILTGTY